MRLLSTLPLLLLTPIAITHSRVATPAPFRIRELICRGKPGIDLKIFQRPSPADARYLRLALRFDKATPPIGEKYENLAPGACTWNPFNFKDAPPEPGVVYFDIVPEAQPWSSTQTRQMDTTMNAAIFFPDTITLPRYLARSDHYWLFYIDDVTNFAISYGATRNTATQPTYVTLTGPVGKAPSVAELRCRGGHGLSFNRGASAGDNKVKMSVTYQVASSEAGVDSHGLTPGSCAWVKRSGLDREPYGMQFITAANAQIVQARTGGTVDKSPTAAERYPDANTIPDYMVDQNHYWSFKVPVPEATLAQSHAAWKPMAGIGARDPSSPSQSTTRSQPGEVGRPRSTATSKTAATATLAKLTFKSLDRRPDGFAVRFTARPNVSATVSYSTSKPVKTPSGWYFEGAALQGSGAVSRGGLSADVRQGTSSGAFADYTGTSRLPLERAKSYNFLITVEGNGPLEQYVGQFTSLQKDVSITVTTLTILKKSFDQSEASGVQVFRNTAGSFSYCSAESCENATDVIGLLAWVKPSLGSNQDPPPESWTAVSGKNSGVGKITIDTRTISADRPIKFFTVRSMPGDVEFEAMGQIDVKWR